MHDVSIQQAVHPAFSHIQMQWRVIVRERYGVLALRAAAPLDNVTILRKTLYFVLTGQAGALTKSHV